MKVQESYVKDLEKYLKGSWLNDMANVQLENGYTKIANEIFEELAKIKLSPTQYRLIFIIWRFTYGFNRIEHTLSLNFFSHATGCDRRQIQRELQRLEERKIISQKIKSGSYRKIIFNKNHDEWVGKTVVGETTIGRKDKGSNGETVNGSIGDTDNQERNKKKYKEINNKTKERKGRFVPALSSMFNKPQEKGKRLTERELEEIKVSEEDFPF